MQDENKAYSQEKVASEEGAKKPGLMQRFLNWIAKGADAARACPT